MDHYWRNGEETNQKILNWLETNYKRPFIAWIHYFDAHEYESQSEYESNLNFVDSQIRELFTVLNQKDIADDTLIVITSDHGEAFGEHRYTGHKATGLYDEAIVVPLIIYWPVHLPNKTINYQVRTIDIAPTILEALGLNSPTEWQGASLFPLIWEYETRDRDAMCYSYPTTRGTRCIRTGNWKYIHYENREDALFDLINDPNEKLNLIADEKRRTVLNMLKAKIFDIENGITKSDIHLSEKDNEMIKDMLRQLGYLD
jgi:arylsulfatase A-like enzyme